MRKFYTMMLAMLCFASMAMALPSDNGGGRLPKTLTVKKQLQEAKSIAKKEVPTASVKNAEAAPVKADISKLAGKKLTGMRKADGNNASIEGTWTFALDDSYLNNSSGTTIYVDFDATLDGTELYFDDPSGEELPFVAEFNAATNKLTFNREYLGSTGQYYVYQQTYNYLVTLDPQSIQATFSPSEGKISFSSYNLLGWEACSDAAGTSKLGYFGLYGLSEAVVSTAWKDLGEASFLENIIYSSFGQDNSANTTYTTHEIYANTENPGVYKLMDPFSALYAKLGFSGTSPQMIIDASDPNNVKIAMQSTGFNGGADGLYQYFNNAWYKENYGQDITGVTCTLTKSDDGIATITIPYHGCLLVATATGSIYYASSYESVLKFQLPEGEGEVDTDTPVVNSIYYLLNREDKTAQVTGCASTLTNLNIPETIDVTSGTYTVTSVAGNAFYNNKTITSATIPATITEVGTDAFRNMTNLRTLNIADLKAWCAINFANGNANPIYCVFPTSTSQWGKVYIAGEQVSTDLVIPEGVTSIGRAFYGFKSLTSVTFPSTLVTMGDQVFANCEGLTEVVIPEGVTEMGSVFFGCKNLASVTLPSTLETLKGSTFYGCSALTEITLPASLKTMGSMIFSSDYKLTKVTCYAVEPPTITGYLVFEDEAFAGELYVPEASIEAYKAANTWKDFTNILAAPVVQDEPADVENIKITEITDNSITLTWDPVKGANDGYIDEENVKYEVVELLYNGMSEGGVLATVTGETTATITYPTAEGEQAIAYFGVRAIVDDNLSDPLANKASVIVGAPYELPVEETFPSQDEYDLFWVMSSNGGRNFAGSDALALMSYYSENNVVTFESGKLNLKDAANPTLMFEAKKGTSAVNQITVYAIAPDGTTEDINTVALIDEYMTFTVNIPANLTEKAYGRIGFKVDFKDEYWETIFIDNIKIVDLKDNDLAIAITAPASIETGAKATIKAVVTNEGAKPVPGSDYTVVIKAGDEVLLNEAGIAQIDPSRYVYYTVDVETSIFDDPSDMVITATVVFEADEKQENNTAEATLSIIEPTAPAVASVTAKDVTDGIEVTWEAPTEELAASTEVTEDFEESAGGWTFIDADGDKDTWTWTVTDMEDMGHSGYGYVSSYSWLDWGTRSPDNWLVSPEAVLDGTFKFWVKGSEQEHFQVYVSTESATDVTKFEAVSDVMSADYGYTEYSVDLSAYAGQTGWVAIRHFNSYWDNLYVDDITYLVGDGAVEIEKYNIYLDGELATTAAADVLTTTIDGVEAGNHTVAVSVVYANGKESKPVEATVDVTTGLNKITVLTQPVDIYSLDGKLVRRQATTLSGLKGVYIVGGKKVVLK
ncbi:MAG: leucine-rich repeat protein [Prevotella sp.]|nr:leucine-rich repeat protein [Prevotella sp.]